VQNTDRDKERNRAGNVNSRGIAFNLIGVYRVQMWCLFGGAVFLRLVLEPFLVLGGEEKEGARRERMAGKAGNKCHRQCVTPPVITPRVSHALNLADLRIDERFNKKYYMCCYNSSYDTTI
jgi:hypothetical protein